MAKVYQSTVIHAPVGRVWAVVRDFNGLPNWHNAIVESRIEQDMPADQIGCIRNFSLQDGGRIREQLVALSDFDLTFSYSILDSVMPLKNYLATMSLQPITENDHTFIDWSAEFVCAAEEEVGLVELIGNEVFQGGFASLKRLIET